MKKNNEAKNRQHSQYPPSQSDFHISANCIRCGASRVVAPDLIRPGDDRFTFKRQPRTDDEYLQAWRAVLVCPVGAVSPPTKAEKPTEVFPQPLTHAVWRLGYNARSSWGAHAYAARTPAGLVMIDAPRWAEPVRDWFRSQGGLVHILLTHRDDIADAQRYADYFGANVWIHQDDRDAAPFATHILTEPETVITEGLSALHMPGHTRGSVVFLLTSNHHKDAPVLFSGDTLAWDQDTQQLTAFRDVCWYSWESLVDALVGLAQSEKQFAHCFAGHGGSISATCQELSNSLEQLIERITP